MPVLLAAGGDHLGWGGTMLAHDRLGGGHSARKL